MPAPPAIATAAAAPFFAPLVAQDRARSLLSLAVARDRLAPAYLFAGPEGTGRALAARCFAALLFSRRRVGSAARDREAPPAENPEVPPAENPGQPAPDSLLQRRLAEGNHPDLLWVEPTYLHQGQLLTAAAAREAGLKRRGSPQIRLEQVREIGRFLSRPPLEAPRSLVVLEGAETMAEGAANGLLKTLEEPGQATLILIAPSPESLLPTLVSRCARIPFERLSPEAMRTVLEGLGRSEVLAQPAVMGMAQGSPGAALLAWERFAAIAPELRAALEAGPTTLTEALDLARRVDRELDADCQLWAIDYLQQYFWQQDWPRDGQLAGGAAARSPSGDMAFGGNAPDGTLDLLDRLAIARRQLQNYVQPRLVWEVALMDLARARVGR